MGRQHGFLLRDAKCNPTDAQRLPKGYAFLCDRRFANPYAVSVLTSLPPQASLEQTPTYVSGKETGGILPAEFPAGLGLHLDCSSFCITLGESEEIKSQGLLLLLPRDNMVSRKMLLG